MIGGYPSPLRVAYLVSHPIRYQLPLIRAVSALPGVQLTAFFGSLASLGGAYDPGFGQAAQLEPAAGEALAGLDWQAPPGWGPDWPPGFWRPFVRGMGRTLAAGRFDVLWLHGFANAGHLAAWVAARRLGIAVLLRDEANAGSRPRSPLKQMLRTAILRRLMARLDGALAIGDANRAHYRALGVAEARLFDVPYGVDHSWWQQASIGAAGDRHTLAARLNIDPAVRPVLLFVGKLLRHKGVDVLIDAVGRMSPDRRPWLVIAGDGEERQRLTQQAAAICPDVVRFAGLCLPSVLPAFYQLADAVAVPSRVEPWGLVVNEAMACNRPVIVSSAVGCAPDLVVDGQTGAVFPSGDGKALAAVLTALLADRTRLAVMGMVAGRRVEECCGMSRQINGVRAALEMVAKKSRGEPGGWIMEEDKRS